MWKFDGKFLIAPFASGGTWPARSGGLSGNDKGTSYGVDGRSLALPNGIYRIVKLREKRGPSGVSQPEMRIPGRRDGWFVPLEPQFATERGTAIRGRFGIHPDGDMPGTNGCIGVFGGSYDKLYTMLTDPSATLLTVSLDNHYHWW